MGHDEPREGRIHNRSSATVHSLRVGGYRDDYGDLNVTLAASMADNGGSWASSEVFLYGTPAEMQRFMQRLNAEVGRLLAETIEAGALHVALDGSAFHPEVVREAESIRAEAMREPAEDAPPQIDRNG